MAKKIIGIIMILIMTFSIFGLTGCANQVKIVYADYYGDYGDYKPLQLVMNAGETYTIETNHFRGLNIDFDKFELEVIVKQSKIDGDWIVISDEGVVSIKNNVIEAKKNGLAEIRAYLHEKGIKDNCTYAWGIYSARIHVIDEAAMTPISTAQELKNISLNLSGNYILKADIDLNGIDWQPIGTQPLAGLLGQDHPGMNAFTGVFVNPYGYSIKNLTISSSENINVNNTIIGIHAGFFGMTYYAYINGLILKNVFIDITDTEKVSIAGGIAAYSWGSEILNCKIDGKIYSPLWAGGIAGYDQSGFYKNCEFKGIVKAQYSLDSCAGGVVGYYYAYIQQNDRFDNPVEEIHDSIVKADIISTGYAGGIFGYNRGNSKPINCTFFGTVFGDNKQDEMGNSIWP